jgi:UDP-2,4-diacetamido-2,4,6-trideoxy-beta-L-altropyranose hydrolase
MQPLALFRCDASPIIGAGHVIRCSALADELLDAGWRVCFAADQQTISTVPEWAERGFEIVPIERGPSEPAALASRFPEGVDLLIVDHYGHDAAFEKSCRQFARCILALDDGTKRQHDCDFLLDSAATESSLYATLVPADAWVLVGPAFALLRRDFALHRGAALARRGGRSASKLLLSFGATDPVNVTSAVLDVLDRVDHGMSVTVVLSSQAPHLDSMRRHLAEGTQLRLDADMAELMTDADLAIGAAGGTALERAALGLPSIVVPLAENQLGMCRMLVDAGAACDAGEPDAAFGVRLEPLLASLLNDADARQRMSAAASALVDGKGAKRVLMAIIGRVLLNDGSYVSLRLAEPSDEDPLLSLQREADVRRYSRNPSAPTADDHARWMRRTLEDPEIILAIVERNGTHAGMARLDRLGTRNAAMSYEVSIALLPHLHGRGIGTAVLSLLRRLRPTALLEAEILPENIASKALFNGAGFVHVNGDRYQQTPRL